MRKVFVAIPAKDWSVLVPTMTTVVQAQAEAHAAGWKFQLQTLVGDADVARARNVLIGLFIASDATDLMWFDADVSAPKPGTFTRIMGHNVDFVAGIYRMKTDQGEFYPVHWPTEKRLWIDPNTKIPLLAADLVPGGFVRLRRDCVQRLCDSVPKELWFFDYRFPDVAIPELYEWQKNPQMRTRLSEDYAFCRKWQALDGTVWVDPGLSLDHTGMKTFEGDLMASLAREVKEHQQHIEPLAPMSLIERAKAALAGP